MIMLAGSTAPLLVLVGAGQHPDLDHHRRHMKLLEHADALACCCCHQCTESDVSSAADV